MKLSRNDEAGGNESESKRSGCMSGLSSISLSVTSERLDEALPSSSIVPSRSDIDASTPGATFSAGSTVGRTK